MQFISNYYNIRLQIKEINTLIAENFDQYPNIIDIDVEGFDYQILDSLDTDKYPVEIIMCECIENDVHLINLLKRKGYRI
ncbi:MAG: FkbM family methyltransferase [Lachnotalea sp.]